MLLTLALLRKKTPGIVPTTTSSASGRQISQRMDFRSFQARIKLVGYPSSSSTGEMLALLTPKLRMLVKTSVFAKPHNPLTKNAARAAIIQ